MGIDITSTAARALARSLGRRGYGAAVGLATCAALAAAPYASANPEDPAPPAPVIDQAAGQVPDAPQVPTGPVPHLPSLQNLPPGTSVDPVGPQESDRVSYARQLWQAVQNGQITAGQALVILAQQRSMDPSAAPPPGLAAGPQEPGPQPPPPPAP